MKRSPCGRDAGVRPRLVASSPGALDGSRAAALRFCGVPCIAFMHSSNCVAFMFVSCSNPAAEQRWRGGVERAPERVRGALRWRVLGARGPAMACQALRAVFISAFI